MNKGVRTISIPRYMITPDPYRTNKFRLTGQFLAHPDSYGTCKLLRALEQGINSIREGDTIVIDNTVARRAGNIQQLKPGGNTFIIQSYSPTKFEPFALTMIGAGFQKNLMSNKRDLAGIFIGHDGMHPIEMRHFLFLYRDSPSKNYQAFLRVLDKHPMYEGEYYPDDYHTMKVFRVPPKYDREYDKIMEGRWSKLDDKFKRLTIAFNSFAMNDTGLCYQRLYKSPKLRARLEQDMSVALSDEDELFGVPVYEQEVYFNHMRTVGVKQNTNE